MFFKKWAETELKKAHVSIGGDKPYDIQVHDERVYRRVALGGMFALGNSYVDGLWDSDALDQFFARVTTSGSRRAAFDWREKLTRIRSLLINAQTIRRSRRVAREHYDLGNELYEMMLGPTMAYSSGYFADGAVTLDDAQRAKFDQICKKLELSPGKRVLEIGCGWGTFAAYAAEHYGVEVVGISISHEQLVYAKKYANDKISFEYMDYRHMPYEWRGTFDAVVSIEMIEAVGPRNLRAYFGAAYSALKPGGVFLVQAILGSGEPDEWISVYIFPGGVLPSVTQIARSIDGLFHIAGWESFGTDYDKTLMEWYARFEKAWPRIRTIEKAGKHLYPERFHRMWRYYLLLCAGAFRSGYIDVAHVVLRRRI